MTVVAYQRETNDWRSFTLNQYNSTTSAWEAYTGAWSYQIVARGSRPTGTWISAVVVGGFKGINILGLTVGHYWIFFRIDGQAGGYIPVLDPVELVMQ